MSEPGDTTPGHEVDRPGLHGVVQRAAAELSKGLAASVGGDLADRNAVEAIIDPGTGRGAVAPARRGDITSYMTDGSLPRLCGQLSTLAGARVTLHDHAGRLIEASEGDELWRLGDAAERDADQTEVGITAGDAEIGSFRIGAGGSRELIDAVWLLSLTVGEVCDSVLELGHRVNEMRVLYRLTSLLSGAVDAEQVLTMALESALDVLELDAGSVVLFEEGMDESDERGVRLKTSRGLSPEWLADPRPLSAGRAFDQLAAEGEVVVVEDLRSDPRIVGLERVLDEGVVGFVTCAMVFRDRPIGAIRLYDREPRLLTKGETRLVRSIAQQAGIAIEQARLLELQAEDRRIQRQLQLAGDVQRRMLPAEMPAIEPFDVAARYVPSFELGGDFYDAFRVGTKQEPHLGLAVGDVVGKGVAAALLMSSVRSSLRAFADEVYDLDEIVSRTNRALARDTMESEFATLWYGVADPRSLHLTYCAAGHEPPLIVRVPEHRAPTTADVDELSTGGMAAGIDPSQRYQRGHFDLSRGDIVVCYTDGITDASNFEGKRFTKRRMIEALLETLSEKPEASAAEVTEGVLWRIRQFVGLARQADDQTLLVMRVR
ncbi:MAG: GAF domain-containing SpoIIE family protein phosphatase [Planctomycetota bacterium]